MKKYKPFYDKLYLMILIPTAVLMLTVTVVTAIFAQESLFFTIPTTLFVAYFFVSPLLAYVELRDDSVYVKVGFFLKKEIPYKKIRAIQKDRKFYADSMISIKNSIEHVNIKYNTFDVMTVSVVDNDGFISELSDRIKNV